MLASAKAFVSARAGRERAGGTGLRNARTYISNGQKEVGKKKKMAKRAAASVGAAATGSMKR